MSGDQENGSMFPETVITLTDPTGRLSPVSTDQKSSFPKSGTRRPKVKTARTLSDKLRKLTSPKSKHPSSATKRISVALDQNWDDKTSICIRQERTEIANFWFKYQHPKYELLSIRLNPFTTFVSLIVIISFICWCITDPLQAQESLFTIKKTITQLFTWLYIGTQDFRTIFVLWLYFSKWGHVKLGKDKDKPEFSDAEWFSMLFACGVGIGLFFFSISEPLRHYTLSVDYPNNRYIKDGYLPDNSLAQIAMNITYYHWGLHAWVVYSIVGIILAFTSYRWDLPLTMKSCFYPLIGEKIFGWLGDSIDTLSIITTIFGVCTSLGLGAIQVSAGLHNLNKNIPMSTNVQIGIIWVITFCATISVVSGLRRGVRRVSQVCFFIGMFLMLVVFFLESPQYLLNLFIQSIGYYIQNIVQLSFHCDAFEQLNPSYGSKDRGRAYNDISDGEKEWMNEWTIFYWSWWIAWSPFVGAFIAKISRGRTIREFITGSITAPVLYSFLWLTIFGGSGIKMEREAASQGLCCPNWNNTMAELVRNQTHMHLDNERLIKKTRESWNDLCQREQCNACSQKVILDFNSTYLNLTDKILNTVLFGSQKDNITTRLIRLSCHEKENMWFFLMSSYGPYGYFLSVVTCLSLVLYLLTSSDSGSLIIDTLSSNGDNEPPVTQRIFWALVEGCCATALLAAGGPSALVAIQTASIVAAFPYTILLIILCVSLYSGLQQDYRPEGTNNPAFTIGLLDFVTTWQPRLIKQTVINMIKGPYTCGECLARINNSSHALMWQVSLSLLLVGWIVFMAVEEHLYIPGSMAIAWTCYFGYVFYVTGARVLLRMRCKIPGNMISDFLVTVFLWPTVIVQMEEHIKAGALNVVYPEDLSIPTSNSIDSKLEKASVDSEMDYIAKMYASFGTCDSNNRNTNITKN